MSQNTSQFLPSLLIDALNSGKRPGQREMRTTTRSHSRQHSSKSRETSLTPGLFSSPSVPIELVEEDGPPRERSELSVYIERSPSPKKLDSSKLLNTPSSLENTVTVYGFPANKRQFVIDLLYSYGSVTSVKQSEKLDGNWVLVTFLTRHSADRALLLDGQIMEDGWVMAVRKGDMMGVMSPKKSSSSVSKTKQSSLGIHSDSMLAGLETDSMMIDDHPPDNRLDHSPPKPSIKGGMTSAYRPSPKSLVLEDSFLDTPSKPPSRSVESPLLYYSERVKILKTPEMVQVDQSVSFREVENREERNFAETSMQFEVSQSSCPEKDQGYYGPSSGTAQTSSRSGFEEPAVVKVGLLGQITDLLFGW